MMFHVRFMSVRGVYKNAGNKRTLYNCRLYWFSVRIISMRFINVPFNITLYKCAIYERALLVCGL